MPVSPLFDKLEWLRMNTKYFYDICILTYKIVNNLLPQPLFEFPTVNQMRTTTNTRHQNSLFIPRKLTDAGARSLYVTAPTFWNSLPDNLRNSHNITSFKSSLFKHLLRK